jgi:hypothetical protein
MAGNKAARNFSTKEVQVLEAARNFGLDVATEINADARQIVADLVVEFGSIDNAIQVQQSNAFNNQQPAIETATQQAWGNTDQQIANTDLANQFTNTVNQGVNIGGLGFTNGLAQINDRATEITNTQGTAGLNELVDAQTTLGDYISVGGMDAGLKDLYGMGRALVASGGFTPELMGFLSQASAALMQQGGMTPEMQKVFNTAQGIIDAGGGGGSLLPIEEMISFARDEAANATKNTFEAARRDQLRREGGSGGAAVGTGGALAEAADDSAQNQAKAVRDASLSAQDMRLQRELAALGIQGNVAGMSAQLKSSVTGALGSLNAGALSYAGSALNAGAGMMSNAQSIGAQKFNTAVGGMTDIGRIFAEREQNAFDNIFKVGTSANDNVKMAYDMNQGVLDSRNIGATNLNTFNTDLANVQQGFNMNRIQNGTNQINNGVLLSNLSQPYWDWARLNELGRQELQLLGYKNAQQPGFWKTLGQGAITSTVNGAATYLTGGGNLPFFGGGSTATDPYGNPVWAKE